MRVTQEMIDSVRLRAAAGNNSQIVEDRAVLLQYAADMEVLHDKALNAYTIARSKLRSLGGDVKELQRDIARSIANHSADLGATDGEET